MSDYDRPTSEENLKLLQGFVDLIESRGEDAEESELHVLEGVKRWFDLPMGKKKGNIFPASRGCKKGKLKKSEMDRFIGHLRSNYDPESHAFPLKSHTGASKYSVACEDPINGINIGESAIEKDDIKIKKMIKSGEISKEDFYSVVKFLHFGEEISSIIAANAIFRNMSDEHRISLEEYCSNLLQKVDEAGGIDAYILAQSKKGVI